MAPRRKQSKKSKKRTYPSRPVQRTGNGMGLGTRLIMFVFLVALIMGVIYAIDPAIFEKAKKRVIGGGTTESAIQTTSAPGTNYAWVGSVIGFFFAVLVSYFGYRYVTDDTVKDKTNNTIENVTKTVNKTFKKTKKNITANLPTLKKREAEAKKRVTDAQKKADKLPEGKAKNKLLKRAQHYIGKAKEYGEQIVTKTKK